MNEQSVWIGNDHGGFELKLKIVDHLKKQNISIINIGSDSPEVVRYPYYAAKVAKAVSTRKAERGILICSTGIGMSIIANKFPGVRASLCYSTYQARMTRAHNNSNILCLGGRCIGLFEALDMLDVWLNTPYEGGRHDISLGLIAEAEKINFGEDLWSPEIPASQ
jgi:ribose 5-phosphate isomerase B